MNVKTLMSMEHWTEDELKLFSSIIDKTFMGLELNEDEQNFKEYVKEQLNNINE